MSFMRVVIYEAISHSALLMDRVVQPFGPFDVTQRLRLDQGRKGQEERVRKR